MSAPHAGELIAFAIVITRTCIHGSLACSHGLWTDHAHCANIAHLLHSHVCSRDVASAGSVVWEGFMSARRPARLFRNTVNVEQTLRERQVGELWSVRMHTQSVGCT